MSKDSLFGTDGIRGRVGKAPITVDTMLRIGYAAGRVLAEEHGGPVVIGKDTRVSGYAIESALESGLAAAGVDVVLLGPMPTPAIAAIVRETRAAAGIVVSASHNPYHDNGIKFFSAAGAKLPDEVEQRIEAMAATAFSEGHEHETGKASRLLDANELYLRHCRQAVPADFSLHGKKLVLDCANGATYRVAPELFRGYGAEVITLGASPDGRNINEGVGSTSPAAMQAAVREHGADLGLAFDGDGDRLVMADADGELVDGDQLLYLMACQAQREDALGDQAAVVGTVMSNLGLALALQERGIHLYRAKVGDRFVHRMLHEHGLKLGGEASGHLLSLDHASTGDGMISALRVLYCLSCSGQSLAAAVANVRKCPQVMINVPTHAGRKLLEHAQVVAAREALERDLDGQGRVILRPSGTEPLVRVTVEALAQDLADQSAQQLAEQVRLAAAELEGK